MRPNLICLGVEKCGTTTLYRLFETCHDIYVPRVKEVFYFNRHWSRGRSWYDPLFADGKDCRFRCDVTPSYFRHDESLDRIADYAEQHDVKFLFLMRSPVYRAFSHYVHDIDRHFGPGLEDYGRSFLDDSAAGNSYHFASYRRALRRITLRLGRDPLRVLVTEQHIHDPSALSTALKEFLGIGLDFQPRHGNRPVANAGSFPRYLYGGEQGIETEFDGRIYRIPARTLVFCSTVKPSSWHDMPRRRAQQAVEASRRWTRQLDAETFQALHERHFPDEVESLESDFGVDLSAWRYFRSVQYAEAAPPEQYLVRSAA